jgi:AraC family transcriptional regulator
MNSEPITLVNLPPLWAAAAHVFGPEPESAAMEHLLAWAGKQNLWPASHPRRFFGFNNPDPSPGNPDYGYEFWMVLDENEDPAPSEDVHLKHFPGGRFAIVRCRGTENILSSWQRLVNWSETSCCPIADNLMLEEFIAWEGLPPDQFVFDLYLPVEE